MHMASHGCASRPFTPPYPKAGCCRRGSGDRFACSLPLPVGAETRLGRKEAPNSKSCCGDRVIPGHLLRAIGIRRDCPFVGKTGCYEPLLLQDRPHNRLRLSNNSAFQSSGPDSRAPFPGGRRRCLFGSVSCLVCVCVKAYRAPANARL